jgi:thiol-disulfide isomerase/thioredoxin
VALRLLTSTLLLVLLTACGAAGGDAGTTEAPPGASPGGDSSAATGSGGRSGSDSGTETPDVPAALDWEAETLTGETLAGSSLAGRPTVLWFWAPWCPTCRGQIPQVQELATRYGDQVNVLGVGSLDGAEAIAGFAEDVPEVTHLVDEAGMVWSQLEVTEQSSFVVLDAEGEETFRAGYGGAEDLDDRVAALVG